MDLTEKQIDIFKRLGHQLELTKNLLERHPLVSDRFIILQNALNNFKLQTQWLSSGQLARLLMTFDMALIGKETTESAAGFAGPTWLKMQKGIHILMKATLSLTERRQADLLLPFNEIISLGIIYIETQLLGNWNSVFYQGDPAAAKKSGLLLRELGMTFIQRSRIIQTAYMQVAQGLGVNEKSQKLMTDIGLFFLLILIILVDGIDSPNNEDLVEAFMEPMKQTISSVEQAALRAQEQGMMESELGMVVLSQLQLIKQTIDSGEAGALKQAIENSCQAFGVSYSEVKKDLSRVIKFTEQINESFNNIFFQSKLSVTSMTQAA